MADLFAGTGAEELGPGIFLWRSALDTGSYVRAIGDVARCAPFRHMLTPGGRRMSVAMTNCGALGWVSDARGYRYADADPDSGQAWPPMPEKWRPEATRLAAGSGFDGFLPDACLINRYGIGARMTAHQDRNEHDYSQPVVSLSLGLPASFAFHGLTRSGRPRRVRLESGDALVWGGPARLYFHGVQPVGTGNDPLCGRYRYNITFRRAGPA